MGIELIIAIAKRIVQVRTADILQLRIIVQKIVITLTVRTIATVASLMDLLTEEEDTLQAVVAAEGDIVNH